MHFLYLAHSQLLVLFVQNTMQFWKHLQESGEIGKNYGEILRKTLKKYGKYFAQTSRKHTGGNIVKFF